MDATAFRTAFQQDSGNEGKFNKLHGVCYKKSKSVSVKSVIKWKLRRNAYQWGNNHK